MLMLWFSSRTTPVRQPELAEMYAPPKEETE
jgi:hypothetical protein